MSTTKQQSDGVDADTAWLERNSRLLDFGDESIKQSDSWERAKSNASDADVKHLEELGRFAVQLDGDEHDVLVVSTPEKKEYVGACDCRGWRMHSGPCAHVATMAMRDVMNDSVPFDEDYAGELAFGNVSGDDVVDEARSADAGNGEVVATTDDDQVPEEYQDVETTHDVQEESNREIEDDVDDQDDRRDDHAEPPTPQVGQSRPKWAQSMPDGALSDPLDELPGWMKTEVDRQGGDVDLNKRGCQVVARTLGLDFDVDFLKRSHETDFQFAVCVVTVTDVDGVDHQATATAKASEDNVSEDGIDEMAETRAKKRAVKWATGGGLEAILKTQIDEQ